MILTPSRRPADETPERHAAFEALRVLLPRLADRDVMPSGVNLVELEREALEKEIDDLAYAKVSKNGKITPSGHAWGVARNEFRPVITEQFKTLGVAGYLREKLKPIAA